MKRTLQLALACVAGAGAPAFGQGAPEISDPDARLVPGFDAPGEFPVSVTAANIDITLNEFAEIDGNFENDFQVAFPAAGPIPWTSSRANGGDLALSIGPGDPTNPLYFPEPNLVDDFQAANRPNTGPIDTTGSDLTALAWRVSYATGGLFATPLGNGIENPYDERGTGNPLGEYFGVSYFNTNFSQGWGFRMVDGVFANGGNQSSDMIMGHAGTALPPLQSVAEATHDTAVSYFPYEQGWTGAWAEGNFEGPGTFAGASPDVDETFVTWENGRANVTIPGVDSATDGMLFVAPSNGSSDTRIASAYPNADGGWTTTVRLDYLVIDDGVTFDPQDWLFFGNDFQFMYIPYGETANLIGGEVDGATGQMVNSAGDEQFAIARNAAGEWALSVFEEDGVTKKTGDDGMIMLSVADTFEGTDDIGSTAFMSYEFDEESGDFILQSRELIDLASSNPNGTYSNEFIASDSDFYFMWVDFENPLSVPTDGDYNLDGVVDAADYTVWRDGLSPDSSQAGYDLWAANYPGAGGPAAVPEPASLLVAALGAGLIAFRRR